MSFHRWVSPLLLATGLAGLPACTFHGQLATPDTGKAGDGTVAQSDSEFGVLRPGERVAMHPRGPGPDGPSPFAADPSSPPPPAPLPGGVFEAVPASRSTAFTTPAQPATPTPPPSAPAAAPAPPDPPLVAAIRAHLDGHPERAVQCLEALDKPNQELMLQVIPALVRMSQIDVARASPHDVGMIVGQLESTASSLAPRAQLYIEKACFCRAARNFGRYEPLPDQYTFKPGTLAELYVEVKNVPSEPTSTPTDGDGYVTTLVCKLRLHDETGGVVELTDRNRKPVPVLQDTKRDFTRSPIRDYFLLFRFPVPAAPGKYSVALEVLDPASGRAVSKPMMFRVQ
ncbi:hypothetical protein [Fimbriiglobus ruber]|uniref:Uncharacterized protein n=1 Tax=Fimbriiglobus ruber TaxID=1908690 RepID=A0A225DJD8_9BACT|nr:hypothetical protein [Fimbriiglobus ruber]OWK41063.1 hypothetical protein FRUB_04955 [Fimbriiglobus ruber]